MASAIRVVILGTVRLYREGLGVALRVEPDLDVVATSRCDQAALAAVADASPHVVVVDVSAAEGLLSLPAVRTAFPSAGMIALAVDRQEDGIVSLLEAEVRGYISSEMTLDDLTSAIRRVAAGESLYPKGFDAMLVRGLASRRPGEPDPDGGRLTPRELQVLGLLRQHLSNKEIADALRISEATVKNHVHHVLEKLKLTRRSQAAALLLPLSRHIRNA